MNPNGDITVDESAAGVIDVTRDQLTADTSGGFWDWKGQTVRQPLLCSVLALCQVSTRCLPLTSRPCVQIPF